MSLSNCMRCGLVFSRTNKAICPECLRKEEDDFQKAIDWVRDNPRMTINALSKSTGIDRNLVLRWVREKRLSMFDSTQYVDCKRCGRPIPSGNFCDRCKLELSLEVNEELKELGKEAQQSGSGVIKYEGMHYRPEERMKKR